MKKILMLMTILSLSSVSVFAMNVGVFAVNCEDQREVIKEIDHGLEAGTSSKTTKEAYFNYIMKKISLAQECSDLHEDLREILRDVSTAEKLKANAKANDSFDKEWEETRKGVKAKNDYYERIRNINKHNRFDEIFSEL